MKNIALLLIIALFVSCTKEEQTPQTTTDTVTYQIILHMNNTPNLITHDISVDMFVDYFKHGSEMVYPAETYADFTVYAREGGARIDGKTISFSKRYLTGQRATKALHCLSYIRFRASYINISATPIYGVPITLDTAEILPAVYHETEAKTYIIHLTGNL